MSPTWVQFGTHGGVFGLEELSEGNGAFRSRIDRGADGLSQIMERFRHLREMRMQMRKREPFHHSVFVHLHFPFEHAGAAWIT